MFDRDSLWMALGTTALLAMLAVRVGSRGPIRFEAPKTVVSNGPPPQNRDESFLLFLSAAAARLPAGSEISVFRLPAEASRLQSDYLFALGQLPKCRVVPPDPRTGTETGEAPEFLGVFGGTFADPRYRIFFQEAGGTILRRNR